MSRKTVALVLCAITCFAFDQVVWASPVFTVRDSIAMTRFSEPSARNADAKINYSPDGRYFIVVTTRGVIAENKVETSVWLFDKVAAANYLRASKVTVAPKPTRLIKWRAAIKADQSDSYGSHITSVVWSRDSKTIYFLGENSQGSKQLYELGISGGQPKALSLTDQDVSTFDVNAGTVVYANKISHKNEAMGGGLPVNAVAYDITGLSWMALLPGAKPSAAGVELWSIRGQQPKPIEDFDGKRVLRISTFGNYFKPAVSLDGRKAVVLAASREFPLSWEAYAANKISAQFKSKPTTEGNRVGLLWPFQYTLVDFVKHSTTPLVNAPSAWPAGYSDVNKVAWSKDQARILLTDTFMPLTKGNVTGSADRLPCAAAVVDLSDSHVECVAATRFLSSDTKRSYLESANFGDTDDDIKLRFRGDAQVSVEDYHLTKGEWKLASPPIVTRNEPEITLPTDGISVTLKQGLNTLPTLWVTDAEGHTKKLWDPAPELSSIQMGEAAIYRWTDATGFEWEAGLIKPPGYIEGQRYPLVIQTHGFHNQNEFITDGSYTSGMAARELAGAGFVVLQMADRYDNHVTDKEAPQMLRGFDSAIEHLKLDGLIDPARVGIVGFSRTCWLVENALIASPERYAAASITDGVDFSYVQSILFDVDRDYTEGKLFYGTTPFGGGLEKWVANAPSFHLDKVQTPLMVTAIAAPALFEEWEIYSSLRQQNKPVSFLYIPNGQHILQNPLDRLASQQSNVDWFRFWLQGYEDPVPEKRDRYQRWESLCDDQIAAKAGQPTFCVPTKH